MLVQIFQLHTACILFFIGNENNSVLLLIRDNEKVPLVIPPATN